MKPIRYYSAIFLICFLLAGCGTSSVSLPENIPSENNSVEGKEQTDPETESGEESLPEQGTGQESERFIENISNNEEGHFASIHMSSAPAIWNSSEKQRGMRSSPTATHCVMARIRSRARIRNSRAGAADVCPTFSFL